MKKRRNESAFASGALVLMLSLTLFYGCRAFDPEPVVVNRPPDTFVIGAPAETTGTGFRRHLYWYGTDRDGDVVQFIYAIMDTSVRDPEDPTTDEENERFNPADDITTVTENEGFVGWTTRTDSVFVFTVDRESGIQKEITFHIVSVDDRGAIDPTPARLRFFNNANGTPRIKFRVYMNVDPQTGEGGELRWVGEPRRGPDAESPEQTTQPFVGFQKPFRIEWEASSPNVAPEFPDPILGYRYKAQQGASLPFIPDVDSLNNKLFGDTQSFFYANAIAQDTEDETCNPRSAIGCDVSTFRFRSGSYVLSVETIDRALVQNRTEDGQLRFSVNYPPQTVLDPVANFVVRDQSGTVTASGTFEDGDRIPYRSEVTFVSTGFDRFPETLPDGVPDDILCCDEPFEFDPTDPENSPVLEVEFQERIAVKKFSDVDERPIEFASQFGIPNPSGVVSFEVAPYEYTYIAGTVDELERRDNEPSEFRFDVGFPPQIVPEQTIPNEATGENRVVAGTAGAVLEGSTWAASRFRNGVFLKVPGIECGGRLLFEPAPSDTAGRNYEVFIGFTYEYFPVLAAANDDRDPRGTVRAWSYSINSENDPENQIEDALESRDLTFFVDGSSPNFLDFSAPVIDDDPNQTLDFWVPFNLFSRPGDFDQGVGSSGNDENATSRGVGCLILKQMGEMKLRFRGRVTGTEANMPLYLNRDADGNPVTVSEDISPFGAKSGVFDVDFFIYAGIDTDGDGTPDRFWPDEQALGDGAGARR
ncbi:MAG TPA: hypothetical protein VKA86_01000 [Candidatus Krumholzibacteria bacterium]|nr:hypothetical protein [Candidatus Krumholzibacteria bacterium]